mmetsp:Transcript_13686/g.19905  ORF Transcript_13686/g.19905 Transcript_13686/m.19905 type:complete len:315 (-) Transcript_13686:2620-3564(-)
MVAAGTAHAVAADATGSVYTWGSDVCRALGYTRTDTSHSAKAAAQPRAVNLKAEEGDRAVFVAAGGFCSMALTEDGVLYAWGTNSHGQLGVGHCARVTAPNKVYLRDMQDDYLPVVLVACGGEHTLAVSCDGMLWLFGSPHNFAAEGRELRLLPTPVMRSSFGGRGIVSVSAGSNHSAVVDQAGTLYTWGEGTFEYDKDMLAQKDCHQTYPGGLGHVGLNNLVAPLVVAKKLLKSRRVGCCHPLPPAKVLALAMGTHTCLSRLGNTPQRYSLHDLPQSVLQCIARAARGAPEGAAGNLHGLSTLLGGIVLGSPH